MKKTIIAILLLATVLGGCSRDADVVSHNLSYAADSFEVNRRIIFFNGITDTYLLSIEGLCSLGNYDPDKYLSVTCKTGPSEYKKHFLFLSDNVSAMVEQIDGVGVDEFRYTVAFRPTVIIPDVDVETP